MFGSPRCGAWVVDWTVVVGAYGEGAAYALAVDDDGGLSRLARRYRLRVRIVVMLDLAEVAALNGSGALLFRPAVSVLDLNQLGSGRNLTVDMGVYLDLIARSVKALVALNVGKEGSVESAATWAGDASPRRRVQGRVFLVKRCIRKGKVEVGLNPC